MNRPPTEPTPAGETPPGMIDTGGDGLSLEEAKEAVRGGTRFGVVYPMLRDVNADGEGLKAFFVHGESRIEKRAKSALEIAREQGFDTEQCPTCSAYKLRRNGTCKVCVECGTTTGCS